MPLDDWQFWLVTVLALAALCFVLRPLIPFKRKNTRCGSCPSEPSAKRTRTSLTIDGERVR
jgi:hypothetical protein